MFRLYVDETLCIAKGSQVIKRGNLLSALKYAEGIGVSIVFSPDDYIDSDSNKIFILDDMPVEKKVCLVLKKCAELEIKSNDDEIELEAKSWKRARQIAKNQKITINDENWFEFSIDSIIQYCNTNNQNKQRDNK